MRLSPQQRHASETRIRQAMDRLLRGDLPPGGKSTSRPSPAKPASTAPRSTPGPTPRSAKNSRTGSTPYARPETRPTPATPRSTGKKRIKALRERLWSTPGLVETRFSPDALVWVAVVFHGTAAWRNHGLIIFPLLFYRTSVQLRCPVAPPGGGLRPPGPPPPGRGHLLVGHPLLRRGLPGLGKGDAQRHRLRRRKRP